jgi:hypothetical protein
MASRWLRVLLRNPLADPYVRGSRSCGRGIRNGCCSTNRRSISICGIGRRYSNGWKQQVREQYKTALVMLYDLNLGRALRPGLLYGDGHY